MSTVLRFLFVIPFGFVLACFAAAFALLWPFVDTSGAAAGDLFYWIDAAYGFYVQTAMIGSVALIPWAVFMVATEIFGLNSILIHIAAGLAAGFGYAHLAYGRPGPHLSVETALVVAGLVFGLVYWIVAGRRAGRWRRPSGWHRPPPVAEAPPRLTAEEAAPEMPPEVRRSEEVR